MIKTPRPNRLKDRFFKTSKKRDGGTMKIFGDGLNPAVAYKTFLLSLNDTAEWIIREMLEKYGLRHDDPQNYCLVQILIPPSDQLETKPVQQRILEDKECPLQLCSNHLRTNRGSMTFHVMRRSPNYLDEQSPMLIEINSDTPRLLRIQPKTTQLGHHTKLHLGQQYFCIEGAGIERDHCLLDNQQDMVTLIPRGEVYCDEKLMTTPWILQHGAILRFGRSMTFRFYDPLVVQKIVSMSRERRSLLEKKSSLYNSLPTLPIHENGTTDQQQRESTSSKINVLPGLLEVPVESELSFLSAIFDPHPLAKIPFRLSPTFALYMALRYRLSTWAKPHMLPRQKQENLLTFLSRAEEAINEKLHMPSQSPSPGLLTYWLANLSELVNVLGKDRDLSNISHELRLGLTESLQGVFYRLIDCVEHELHRYRPALIDPLQEKTVKSNHNHFPTIDDMLAILSSLLNLLRKSRVNAVLTIQIFGHLFLSISSWLFNQIVGHPELNLCSYDWGEKFSVRLKSIRHWAQKQGLEYIFDYHFVQVNQLCSLLLSSKRNLFDAEQLLSDKTWKINAGQVRQVLKNYTLTRNELPMSNSFTQSLITAVSDHFPVQLEESNLRLAFILPEDGYTYEHLVGVPPQLLQFIETISRSVSCRLFIHPHSLGYWTEFISAKQMQRLETIQLKKNERGLGLSIVSAKSNAQQSQGIYIRGIISGSVAEEDGRLQAGDQLLAAEGISLIDVGQEQATEILRQCQPLVTLQVLKNAAYHQGLSALLARTSSASPPLKPDRRQERISNGSAVRPATQYRSNPNLSETKQPPPVILREDIPFNSPAPTLSTFSPAKPVASPSRLLKVRVSSPSRRLPSPLRKSSRHDSRRSERIHDLITKIDRTEEEERELKHLKLEEEFQRRFGELPRPSRPATQPSNLSRTDDANQFDEKLKRRLDQFDHERDLERIYMNQFLAKRQTDIELRIRQERERNIRADREMKDFQIRHTTEQEQAHEARREHLRLSRHIHFPILTEKESQSFA